MHTIVLFFYMPCAMRLLVQRRSIFGKKVKQLRKEGYVPGVIYGKHVDTPLSISMPKIDLLKLREKAGKNTPCILTGDGIDELVLFHDIQLDPVTDRILHVDFLAVNKNEKVRAEVPVVLQGVSPFEKNNLGRVQLLRNTLEVEALPMSLPHDIKIDISSFDREGIVLHISDIEVGENVSLIGDPELTVLATVGFDAEEGESDTGDQSEESIIGESGESNEKVE